jgi:hypothetical protein
LIAKSDSASADPSAGSRLLIIALVAAGVLVFEIAVTRILSVTLWYHFAFLAVSLAMLGIGLPGVWLAFARPSSSWLPLSLAISSVASPLTTMVLVRVGTSLDYESVFPDAGANVLTHLPVLTAIVCMLVPLLASGTAICLLLMEATGSRVARLYGADLLGATAGAALVVPLMLLLPTPVVVAGTGLLPAAALSVFKGRWRITSAALLACIAALLIWQAPLRLARGSKQGRGPVSVLFERWTPTGRITVLPEGFYGGDAFAWGIGGHYRVDRPVPHLWMEQDGSAGTPITRLDGSPASLEHLFFDVTSLGYQWRPPQNVCIVGPGGGRDILTALKADATWVDAVELNPAIVDALQGPFREYSGDVYGRAGVHAVVGEGRSFLTRSRRRYDLIQVSLIDSWAATAAGAFSLSENYLYTREALQLYLSRLQPAGVLSISRWMRGSFQMEGARLAVLVRAALQAMGAADPDRHFLVYQAGSVATFLVSPTAIDAASVQHADSIAAARGFVRHWPAEGAGATASLIQRVLTGQADNLAGGGADLSPPTDDRPFFFHTLSIFHPPTDAELQQLGPNEQAVAMLRMLVTVLGGVGAALFLLPFVVRGRLPRDRAVARSSFYFLAIGVAFMFVEIPWLQRFVLYLGHPSYATTVVLSALLVGAGLGAMASPKLARSARFTVAVMLPMAILLLNVAMGVVLGVTLGWSLGWRVVVAIALVFPAGVLMGAPFPVGMMLAASSDRDPSSLRAWFWAMNGMASVLASVLSLACAMTIGFVGTVAVGAVAYALAGLALPTRAASLPRP